MRYIYKNIYINIYKYIMYKSDMKNNKIDIKKLKEIRIIKKKKILLLYNE